MTEESHDDPKISSAGVRPRVTLEVVVIRACPKCGDSRIRLGQVVDGACPGCGAPSVEDLGK